MVFFSGNSKPVVSFNSWVILNITSLNVVLSYTTSMNFFSGREWFQRSFPLKASANIGILFQLAKHI
jgi:hypothetical protein